MEYSIQEAQQQLKQLIEDAQQGKTVLIKDESGHIFVQLVPVPTKPSQRKAGSARGLVQMADDFDAPLADFDEYSR